jgi:hypothetical protein
MVRPRLDLSRWPAEGRVSFDTRRGHRLDLTVHGPHAVDGNKIDYAAWPMVESPWVNAALGTGQVSMRHGSQALELDFAVNPEKPVLPMRVIG